MIDLIKFEALNKPLFELNLEKNTNIKLESKYDIKTGEPLTYPKKGRLENFDINITDKKAYINGSIHKFHNIINESDYQNYNDFTYSDIRSSIDTLCANLLINPVDTKITNLEFGFNLEINQDPQHLIESNILMYDFKDHNHHRKYKGNGDFKEFEMSDYSIKVYNKSKQYKLSGKNILRIELKITKSRYLEKLGIFNLDDLSERKLKSLYKDFLKHFEKLLILDTSNHRNRLNDIDESSFYLLTNPVKWITYKRTKTLAERNKIKSRFFKIYRSYKLNQTKNELRDIINNKFIFLMTCFNAPDENLIKVK